MRLYVRYTDPAMNGQHWQILREGEAGIVISGFTYGFGEGIEADLVDAYNHDQDNKDECHGIGPAGLKYR